MGKTDPEAVGISEKRAKSFLAVGDAVSSRELVVVVIGRRTGGISFKVEIERQSDLVSKTTGHVTRKLARGSPADQHVQIGRHVQGHGARRAGR